MFYDCGYAGGCNVFDKIVIDERDGGTSAAGEALDELDAELAIGGRGWRAAKPMVLLVGIESYGLAEFFLHFVAASEGAGECAADADHGLASLLASEPGIKCDQLEDIYRREVELGGDPFDAAVVDETEVVLPEVQQGEGGAALRNRIVGNEFLRLGGELGRDGIRLTRGGFYHGNHLSEVGASSSRKSILAQQGYCASRGSAVDFKASDATFHHGSARLWV